MSIMTDSFLNPCPCSHSTSLPEAVEKGAYCCVNSLLRAADSSPLNGVLADGETLLHKAVAGGRPELVKLLLDGGANPNVKNSAGLTPLHAAVCLVTCTSECTEEIVRILIAGNPRVMRGPQGDTAVSLAFEHRNVAALMAVAKLDALPSNWGADRGTTFHHEAVRMGDVEFMKALTKLQPRCCSPFFDYFQIQNVRGITPLDLAAMQSSSDVLQVMLRNCALLTASALNHALTAASGANALACMEILIAHGSDVNGDGRTCPMDAAAQAGHLEAVTLLLRHGARPYAKVFRGELAPIHGAARAGSAAVVKALLDAGVDVDTEPGESTRPLELAVRFHHPEVVKVLLEAGAFIHEKPEKVPLLLLALKNGDKDIADLLVEHGANVEYDTTLVPLICRAVEMSSPELLQSLVNLGCDPTLVDSSDQNAIHHCVRHETRNLIALLVQFGVAVNKVDRTGTTPLLKAIISQKLEIAEELLRCGADPEQRMAHTPPLLVAISMYLLRSSNGFKAIEFLLKKGADPNVTVPSFSLGRRVEVRGLLSIPCDQVSPLLAAVTCRDDSLLKLLVKYGVEVNRRDRSCTTALHIAAQLPGSPGFHMINSLVKVGADVNALNNYHETPLHFAAKEGKDEAVRLLVAKGADVNLQTVVGDTALSLVTKWQLKMHPDRDRRGKVVASEFNNAALPLVEAGADVKGFRYRATLKTAVEAGLESLVLAMLRGGATLPKASGGGSDILGVALSSNQFALCFSLLKLGVGIEPKDAVGDNPLQEALRNSRTVPPPELFDAFFQAGMDATATNADGDTLLALVVAVAFRAPTEEDKIADVVRLLVSRGVDPTLGPEDSSSPIDQAIRLRSPSIFAAMTGESMALPFAKRLCEQCCRQHFAAGVTHCIRACKDLNINDKNDEGDTLVHTSIRAGSSLVLSILLRTPGVYSEAENNAGQTPLLLAAQLSDVECFRLLLENRANIFAEDYEGNNLAHYIAFSLAYADVAEYPASYLFSVTKHWLTPVLSLRNDAGWTAEELFDNEELRSIPERRTNSPPYAPVSPPYHELPSDQDEYQDEYQDQDPDYSYI